MAIVSAGAATRASASALLVSTRDVTFSSSYATGGEAISAASFGGLQAILFAFCTVKTAAGSVTEVRFDQPTGKLIAMTSAGEVTAATNLSALVVEVVAFGSY